VRGGFRRRRGLTSRGTEGISVARGAAGRGTLASARVGCFIASISNIILHTRLGERERNNINSITYANVRFINNINSCMPLKDNAYERERE